MDGVYIGGLYIQPGSKATFGTDGFDPVRYVVNIAWVYSNSWGGGAVGLDNENNE